MQGSGVILLTGATGFLGTQVARRLVADTACTVIALVRAEDDTAAARRLARAWWDWPELVAALEARVDAVAGDVRRPRLGLDEATFNRVVRRVTHIVHTAAELRLEAPLDELRDTNVLGTQHVLELARAVQSDHGLERFAHVSTAYVCGARRGVIEEQDFSSDRGFSTPYEQSKFEGEQLVRGASAELPISIFRPGMIVGDSRTGAVQTFNTLYVPLRLYLSGQLPFVPTNRELRLNIVPVDYVAACIARLTFDPRAMGLTFHLVAPASSLPTAGDFIDAVREWAAQRLGLRVGSARFVNVPLPAPPGTPIALRVLRPYLADWRTFRRDNVDRLLGPCDADWHDFLPRLLEYAVAHGFLHRSERTVYEQVVYRLAGKRWRVRYHDITPEGVVTRDTLQVRREMLAAAAALRALGIGAGDRVAIVGLNSSRYLTLDVAIGLVAAVSVPLYYTSPPAEIDALLRASRARLLLVGAPRLLARIGELTSGVQTVAFGRGALPPDRPADLLSWEQFLALGAAADAPHSAPATFGDVATLRYTSGTTGPPKGVKFHHGNLRWMAETMASLLPWRVRTRPAAYLSFLPMNHVVEGMLATYSAYFLPAPVDIYFLEDFHGLAAALPLARPTVFFSVPRVYERVWENLRTSWLGRSYLGARPGVGKDVLRAVARQVVLRRAGFDRSVQLIVGSAAVPEGLLRSFRELGIEIHNAYGLTEAPLVTMNRLGANRLGTVGQRLPETQVAIADDGEVLVRGPQVTPGYDGIDVEQPFRAGWLLTGDLGSLTPDGSLVIDGRKKELIATSYGKKVQIARVEGLLRQIPGVTEAMLVGEARPYCTALLWTAADTPTPALAQGVEGVNAQLSHAEQIKRWHVCVDDLSIERGDLTPNLKLRRKAVAERFARDIDALYAEDVRQEAIAR